MNAPHLPAGLRDLAPAYDGFVVDLWGVLHDGVTAFPAALDCMARLKAQGRKVLILSNAPRRSAAVIERNAELGIGPQHFDLVLSSGEATWRCLKERTDPWYAALGRRAFQLGPARDLGMREGLDLEFVEDLEVADFILLTGALDSADTVADYDALLARALARRLPMACANPDLEVIRGGQREICAGAIAQAYEERGGPVRYQGKPHPEVYRTCLALLGMDDPARLLAIGDSLRTDIAGARACGMAGLFIAGGIHAEELGLAEGGSLDPARLAALFAQRGLTPDATLPHLVW